MNISVCMATYNGGIYISEQLDSIIKELAQDDEIIIVDDCSIDNTVEIIKNLDITYIKLFKNDKNIGHVKSFEKAISLSKNDFIFLADQDDIWVEGRVELMKNRLINNEKLLASSNFKLFKGNSGFSRSSKYPLNESDSENNFLNLFNLFMGRRDYYGCAMVFRKDLVKFILPIPKFVEAHDWWIVMAGIIKNASSHIESITILRRLHDSHVTNPKRKIYLKLKSRIIFFRMILCLWLRKFK